MWSGLSIGWRELITHSYFSSGDADPSGEPSRPATTYPLNCFFSDGTAHFPFLSYLVCLLRDVDAGRAQMRLDQRVQPSPGWLLLFSVVGEQAVPVRAVGAGLESGRDGQQ